MTATLERTTVDARVDRLRAAAEEAGLDAVLATNDASIAYLTGFSGMQLERLFAVAVPVAGGGALVVPRLEEDAAAAAPSGLGRVVYDPSSDGMPELVEALGGPRTRGRGGRPPRLRPRRGAPGGRLRPVRRPGASSWACARARTRDEVERMRKTCRARDRGDGADVRRARGRARSSARSTRSSATG